MVSPRVLVSQLRLLTRKIPLVGHALRYGKRLVMMPWNFHKLLAAWSDLPPAQAAQSAAWDAAGSTKEAVYTAANQTTTNVVKTVVTWGDWNIKATQQAADTLKRELTGSTHTVMTGLHTINTNLGQISSNVAIEVQKLSETHAVCYDRLVESIREMAKQMQAMATHEQLQALTQTIEQLSAQVETLTDRLNTLKAATVAEESDEPAPATNGIGSLHLLRHVG